MKTKTKKEKPDKEDPVETIMRDGSALGAIFVVGNLLDRLRETYFPVNRDYVETLDAMRKSNETLRKSIAMDLAMGIKNAK